MFVIIACFRCDAGKRCIKSSWVCDNLADCEDFSDEMPETCGYDGKKFIGDKEFIKQA